MEWATGGQLGDQRQADRKIHEADKLNEELTRNWGEIGEDLSCDWHRQIDPFF